MARDKAVNVRVVCLSDTHLGEEESLLTGVNRTTGKVELSTVSPVMKALIDCLAAIVEANPKGRKKPTLVLNGDVLELALAMTHEAGMVFEQFITLAMAPGRELFDRTIIVIPGNHDHHLWEMGREEQYTHYVNPTQRPGTPSTQRLMPAEPLAEPRHTTSLFAQAKELPLPKSEFLTHLANRARTRLKPRDSKLPRIKVEVAYPNYAIIGKPPAGRGKAKVVVFHHGHFIELMYRLMSEARKLIFPKRPSPKNIYELEGENFAWIDFAWSALGRSGGVGRDMETVYENMNDAKWVHGRIDAVARALAVSKKDGRAQDWVEEKAIGLVLRAIARSAGLLKGDRGKQESAADGLPLSEDAKTGMKRYVNLFLYQQIVEEYGQILDDNKRLSRDVSFVFGHTHKPFSRSMRFGRNFPVRVALHNTGGWVADCHARGPEYGGSVVLVDNACDVVNLRLFHFGPVSRPKVLDVARPGGAFSDLFRHVDKIVSTPGFASNLTSEVAKRVERRG